MWTMAFGQGPRVHGLTLSYCVRCGLGRLEIARPGTPELEVGHFVLYSADQVTDAFELANWVQVALKGL